MPRFLLVAMAAVLAGCATPYQERGLGGGFQEREVGANRWYVEFFGNGHTSRDTVMAFWLYRCAELTAQKGFDYFVILAKRPAPGAAWESEEPVFVRTKGGGGSSVPIYVPGGTATTWSSRGVIELRQGDAEADPRPSFVAREILDKLSGPVAKAQSSGGNVVLPAGLFAQPVRERPAGTGPRLQELDGLLPKE